MTAAFACADSLSGVAACPPAQSTETGEGDGLVLTGTATDFAGLTTTVSETVKVDRTAPSVPVVTLDPTSRPIDSTTSLTATSSDTLSGLAGGEWWIGADPGEGNATTLSLSAGSLSGVIPSTLATGSYVVSVRALDLAGNRSAVATALLTVTGSSPPIATPQTVATPEDTPRVIVLAGTDLDAADVLSFVVVSQPAHGALSGTAPNLTYTPVANFTGSDSFTYRVNDGTTDSNTTTVTITVTPANDSPVAAPMSVSTARHVAVTVTLSATDVDNDVLSFAVVSQPTHGALSGSGATLTYTSGAGYSGPDSFTYKANDGTTDSNLATVSITVIATKPPSANPIAVSTAEDTAVAVTLSGTDPDGDALSFVVATLPTHGSLSGSGANRRYTPAANYNGPDSFTFTANDASATSAVATVSINVTSVNDPPMADPATMLAVSGEPTPVTLFGNDGDGDPLTFVVVEAPAHGTLAGEGPNFSYTSGTDYVGSDSFSFAVSDSQSQSPAVTVPITVTPPPRLTLSLADDPSRTTNPRRLAGAALASGISAYIFVSGPALGNVRRVNFLLDGNPFSIDRSKPFDFAQTSNRRACRRCVVRAYPFESNLLTLGSHSITATALLRDGSQVVFDSTFTVADTTPHSLVVSPSVDRSSPTALDGATLAGGHYIFLSGADDSIAGLRRVVFVLDGRTIRADSSVPYDAFGTRRRGSPVAFDTRRVRNGTHLITAIVQLQGGVRVVYTAEFQVAN